MRPERSMSRPIIVVTRPAFTRRRDDLRLPSTPRIVDAPQSVVPHSFVRPVSIETRLSSAVLDFSVLSRKAAESPSRDSFTRLAEAGEALAVVASEAKDCKLQSKYLEEAGKALHKAANAERQRFAFATTEDEKARINDNIAGDLISASELMLEASDALLGGRRLAQREDNRSAIYLLSFGSDWLAEGSYIIGDVKGLEKALHIKMKFLGVQIDRRNVKQFLFELRAILRIGLEIEELQSGEKSHDSAMMRSFSELGNVYSLAANPQVISSFLRTTVDRYTYLQNAKMAAFCREAAEAFAPSSR